MSNKPSKEQIDELLALLGGKGSTVDMNLRNHGEEEGLCEETLVRWLVARKLDVNAAAKDLKAHAEWRTTYMPSGRVDPVSSVGTQALPNRFSRKLCQHAVCTRG